MREATANAQLKEVEYHERVGNLVPAELVEQELGKWAALARSEIENAVDVIVAELESRHRLEIDRGQIDRQMLSAYRAIARYPRMPADDPAGDGEAFPEKPNDVP